jgi:predicted hydrocarbon binding protein/KaiC/GvpD/RAD55 family RecA-like ATPase
MVSLAQLQEVPSKNMVLLVGPPGSGKSYFCEQAVLHNLALDKPVIYITTEGDPSRVEESLREKGLASIVPNPLRFVDAYSETVGLLGTGRPDTVVADCANLSSIGIAISKLQEQISKKNILLVFNSLTSPYLLNGSEVVRFMRLTLSRFVGEGNSVLACFDEGSSKEEDLVAMMSLSEGVLKIEKEDNRRMLNVVKYPKVEPKRIEIIRGGIPDKLWDMEKWRGESMDIARQSMQGKSTTIFRSGIGDFINLFWSNFVRWSNILWDPKRFLELTYEMSKKHGDSMKEIMSTAPWHQKSLFKLMMPKTLSKVKDMKKLAKILKNMLKPTRFGSLEYLEDASKTDEHYFRLDESGECWGFENVGATMASVFPSTLAGMSKGVERWRGIERDWNAVEVKCIGLGDPYCEIKVVPGEIDELKHSFEAIDNTVLEKMRKQLMIRLRGFLVENKPLINRPKFGSDVMVNSLMHTIFQPALAGERWRLVLGLAGAKAGKEISEQLLKAGLIGNEAVNRFLEFLRYCKVGEVNLDKTIRIKENCESVFYRLMTKKREEPSCYFTTGFLNGFFSAVKSQHVKEVKCIAVGDPYCEWEFR